MSSVTENLCNKCPNQLVEQNSSYSDYFNPISDFTVTGLNFEITYVNNTSSSTTCFKYCVSLDFRPSIMEFPTRHLVLCNRVYLSGCSQFKQVGTRSNQLDLVPVRMI